MKKPAQPTVKGLVLIDTERMGGKNSASWRTKTPRIDEEACNGCGLCVQYCPEAAITKTGNKPVINLDFCKGCGICANECPRFAVRMVE
jgi:pyruvate ferredoxin oxidoreductase delta subunit